MEKSIVNKILIIIALALTSCGPRQDDLRKYVGDGKLKPANMSPRETVSLVLAKETADGTANLEMILTPQGQLSLKRYAMHWPPFEGRRTEGPTDMLNLSPELAVDFRRRIAQLRPAELGPAGPMLWPKDCGWTYDDRDRADIVFIEDNKKNWGSFVIQFSCTNSNASKVAAGLRQAILALPANQATDGFNW